MLNYINLNKGKVSKILSILNELDPVHIKAIKNEEVLRGQSYGQVFSNILKYTDDSKRIDSILNDYRLNEEMTFNGAVNATIDPQHDLASEEELETSVKNKLLRWANTNNISVEFVRDLFDKGAKVQGIADIFNRSIKVAQGGEALSEEISHFYVESQEGTQELEDALSTINRSKKYRQQYPVYSALYMTPDGIVDERKIRKEILAQLIAENLDGKQDFMSKIKRFFGKVISVFSNARSINLENFVRVADNAISNNKKVAIPLNKEIYYSATSPSETNKKLQALNKVKLETRDAKGDTIHDYITDKGEKVKGVTETVNESGFVKKFDEAAWLAASKKGATADELLALDEKIKNFPLIRDSGTELHKISELVFANPGISDWTGIAALYVRNPSIVIEDAPLKAFIEKMFEQRKRIWAKKKGTATVVMVYPELSIIDPEKKIAGTIDLLVEYSDGSVDIYDYKTSPKDVKDWDENKILTMKYQMSFYKNILQRNGIKVDSLNIIPVSFLFDKGKVSTITPHTEDDLSFQILSDGKIKENVNKIIPFNDISSTTAGKSVEKTLRQMKALFNEDPETTRSEPTEKEVMDYVEKFELIKTQESGKNKGKKFVWQTPDDEGTEAILYLSDDKSIRAKELTKWYKREKELKTIQRKLIIQGIAALREDEDFTFKGGDAKNSNLKRALYKYYEGPDNKWEIVDFGLSEQDWNEMELIALKNKVTGVVDFISVTNSNNIQQRKKMNFSSSARLTGNFYKDNEAPFIAPEATIANFLLMKTGLFIMGNPALSSIGDIRVIGNNDIQISSYEFIRKTIESFVNDPKIADTLSVDKPSYREIHEPKSYDAIDALYKYLSDLTSSGTRGKKGKTTSDLLSQMINPAISSGDVSTWDYKTPQGKQKIIDALEAYLSRVDIASVSRNLNDSLEHQMVTKALLQLKDMDDNVEKDLADWGNAFGAGESKQLSSPTKIQQGLVKALVELTKKTISKLADVFAEYHKAHDKVLVNLQKRFGYSMAQDVVLGYKNPLFANLIDESSDKMLLKWVNPDDPNDPTNDTSLTFDEAAYIRFFISKTDQYRTQGMNVEARMLYYQDTDRRREIPLMEGGFYEKVIKPGPKGVVTNVFDSFKRYWNEAFDMDGLFSQDERKKETILNQKNIVSGFKITENPDKRLAKLQEYKEQGKSFEKNLGLVLDSYVMSMEKSNLFTSILPTVNAIRMSLMFSAYNMNTAFPNLQEWMENYIANNVYNKQVIKAEDVTKQKTVKAVTDTVSILSLGLSPIAGINNFLQSSWATVSKTFSNLAYKDKLFGFGELAQASGIMMSNGKNLVGDINIVNELNGVYKMNGLGDPTAIQQYLSSQKNGFFANFKKWSYWMMSAPDYYWRMTSLIAQMIKDGSWKAHSYTEENGLVYDWKKDERFKILTTAQRGPQYKEALARYKWLTEQLKDEQGALNEAGEPLRAYCLSERNSMKEMADDTYASFDKSDKVFFSHTIIGRMMMQFKTWLISKKNFYYLERQQSNFIKEGTWVTELDPDGNPVIGEDGTPNKVFIYQGKFQEGIFQTLYFLGQDIISQQGNVFKTWDTLEDYRKSNLYKLFSELIIMALMTALLTHDEDDPKETAESQLLRMTLLRSVSDLNPIANLTAMVPSSNSSIVSVSFATRVVNDMYSVLWKENKPLYTLLRDIGLTRTIYPFIQAAN
jgi:hypothetical protein